MTTFLSFEKANGKLSEEETVLTQNISNHFNAINLCLSNNLRMPALVLIYSGIDMLAALGRPQSNPNVTRKDFINWCEHYLVPAGFNQCTPIDLYAARCGVVHTYIYQNQT
jgi:hypothetical protein